MKEFFHKHWPILVLLGVEILIAAANYKPGTFLMGWDNVIPEFNFKQALITNIFGAWQEHRGLGLPDGMGHAANLVHTVFTWMLSLIAPQSAIRYIVQFFLHFMGMVGSFRLLKSLKELRSEKNTTITLPLVGALFYGLNPVTIQMFYTPLEAFSFHYAALPWLAFSLLRYLYKPNRNTLLLFTIVSILTTPQFFIPTLLLPTAILLGVISIGYVIFPWRRISIQPVQRLSLEPKAEPWAQRTTMVKTVLTATTTFLCVNAFWLLPYLYNLPYNAPIIRNAKINQMSSDEVYERNRAFGDIGNLLTMKGFMLNFEDINAEGQPVFVMDTWRNWFNLSSVRTISIILAGIVLIGFVRAPLGWKVLFAVPILILANNTSGVSDVMNVIRDRFPLFAEAYRFPFTKFSLLYGFASSVLLVYGFSFARPGLAKLGAGIVTMAVFAIALPMFQGHMFYDALRVNLPQDYIQLFTFMQKQDHDGRIAYLPQPSYWSWKHYNFGLVGSGFLWYGLPQPLMDRAFDPWSNLNEQYYWELSQALYSKNTEKLNGVLLKYDVQYIILDENLRAPGHDRSLFVDETKELFSTLPIARIATFETLNVYERQTAPTSFVQTVNTLPVRGEKPHVENTSVLAFSTKLVEVLMPQAVKPCGVLKNGNVSSEVIDGALRIRTRNQRACISFGDHTLPHAKAYRVEVTTKNTSGRPLLFAIINETAKHVEVESYLRGSDTFYLPPLAPDGLGYTVYFSSDAIVGESINDIVSVVFYEIDYKEPATAAPPTALPVGVSHPNPAWYRVTIPKEARAVILSQAYNPNWIAFSEGKIMNKHSIVNNWANGWEVSGDEKEVYIIFWPQLLQYVGFVMLGVLFLFLYKRNRQSRS